MYHSVGTYHPGSSEWQSQLLRLMQCFFATAIASQETDHMHLVSVVFDYV